MYQGLGRYQYFSQVCSCEIEDLGEGAIGFQWFDDFFVCFAQFLFKAFREYLDHQIYLFAFKEGDGYHSP